MKWKVMLSLLAFVSLFGAVANAQEPGPKFDVFAGYSYVRANPSSSSTLVGFNLNGGSASVAYNVTSWLSGVADFGGYHTSNLSPIDVDGTFLFGPRVSYRRFHRITPFGQVLFGVVHNRTSGQTPFAMAIGGGLDYRLSEHFAVRPAQVDYLLTRFDEFLTARTQNNLRVSTGIVFRF